MGATSTETNVLFVSFLSPLFASSPSQLARPLRRGPRARRGEQPPGTLASNAGEKEAGRGPMFSFFLLLHLPPLSLEVSLFDSSPFFFYSLSLSLASALRSPSPSPSERLQATEMDCTSCLSD